MFRAYKYRIYPNAAQKQLFERTFGCCRYVYNWALETRTTAYHDRDLLAANNIKLFGLQEQNLIGQSPAVSGVGRVESSPVGGALKREYVQFANVN